MDINELTLRSLKNYYAILKRTGTLNNSQVMKLLVLVFISDLFDEYSWYIEEKEYSFLTGIVECLAKSTCIIPFNILPKDTEPIKNFIEDIPIRISEQDVIHLVK